VWAIDVKLQASVMAIAEIAEVTPCRTIARFAVTFLALIHHALAIAAAFTRPLALPLLIIACRSSAPSVGCRSAFGGGRTSTTLPVREMLPLFRIIWWPPLPA
jgi:hypothetical protein